MRFDLLTILDVTTDIIFYSILALTLRTIYYNKSTRNLFSITLWITWVTVVGLLLLPEEYNQIVRGTLTEMTGLLFLTSFEYRSQKNLSNQL